MDNLATGFAFGMGNDEFVPMDFQTSMAGDVDAASSTLMYSGMGPYTAFSPAVSRESVFPQGNLMGSRAGGMDLPRFPLVSYAQNIPVSGANFNPMMSPRHAFSASGLPGISSFGEMFSQPGADIRAGEGRSPGLVDSIAEQLPSFGSIMGAPGPPPSSVATSVMPSSMPVFPTTPSSMMHTTLVAPDSNPVPIGVSKDSGDFNSEGKSLSVNSSVQGHSQHSPVQSSMQPLQNCFPGKMAHQNIEHTHNNMTHNVPGQSVSQLSVHQSESKPIAGQTNLGVPSISYSAVTPMQRRRQSPRRAAAMAAQAVAASAAAELAVKTKQVHVPRVTGTSPQGVGFSHSMRGNSATFRASSQQSYPPSRRSTGMNTESVHLPSQQAPSSVNFPRRRTIVPFYKAGRFSLREPEVFECQTRKVPQVTESVQTGHDVVVDELPMAKKSLFPVNPNSCDVDPMDGKGGFPVQPPACEQKRIGLFTDANDGFKSYVEGEGYAKRGNSKTVVSPSFGEAAARAVMTTSVGDSATVVTVAIMSRQNSTMKAKTPYSVASPGASRDVSQLSDDLKENVKNDTLYGESGVQTRRGRRSSSAMTSPTMVQTSQRGRTLRRRVSPGNISVENDDDFERLMEERKEKARAAEQERMEISIRIDDSQCVSYGEQKRWQCDLCDKSYTTKHNLVMHMLDHNGIKPHLCLVCGKYFKQLSHLNTHMLTHDKVRPHICNVCGKGFTQISHLKRHLAVHQDSKPYSCDECGRGFCFPSELRLHKERHQQGIFQVDHSCSECEEEFSSGAMLKQHMLIHENRDDLCCRFCGRKFRYPSQLKDHIVIHSGSRPYMCTECGMDFMKEHHLRAHQFTHTGLRPYSCPDCGRSFNQRANMLRHRLIHKAERSYKCEYCGKTFTQPQTLKAHMVVHADHKPFQCNQCGKEFGRLHNLHGHMHMHSDSKPYVCFCGSSFTLKGNLNRHKKVKHGLNESTESMEEEAVNFLSSLSERYREERSGDDTMDGTEVNGFDADGSSLDMPDKGSSRKQRKSTPRKIPRRSSGGARRDSSGDGREDDDDEELEEEEEENDVMALQFQALTDEAGSSVNDNGKHVLAAESENIGVSEDANFCEAAAMKRSRRDRSHQRSLTQNGDFVPGLSDSDEKDEKDDGGPDEQDDDWVPSNEPRKKHGKGAKLDSLIAEKFKSS